MSDMENGCGFSLYHPKWLQRFANARIYLLVHGILGTVQGMCEVYFAVTLTTLEKQYKIRTQTIGIILSGNLVSQVLFALILSYAGGQRNRPKWIAQSVLLGGISSFLLACPYFIFGASEETLQLTKEYLIDHLANATTVSVNSTAGNPNKNLCLSDIASDLDSCQITEIFSYFPLVLIFFAQFALGIGTALHFSLGQSYLDDNVKMKDSPLLQSYALSMRMFGPVLGYYLGFFTLNIYVDPSKTPIIMSKDPRWVGAWWLGWIFLSILLLIFSVLIALFPRKLPTRKKSLQGVAGEGEQKEFIELEKNPKSEKTEKSQLKDFPCALRRLLTNKLLVLNYFSSIFYVLGSNTYHTYLTKYIEVQFNKTAAAATIFTGPISIVGMMVGFISSGYLMTKYKIHARKLYLWCVMTGVIAVIARNLFMHIDCENSNTLAVNDTWFWSTECNAHCKCESVQYNPVCDTISKKTFFSACHAGCETYNEREKYYSNCSCGSNIPLLQVSPLTANITEVKRPRSFDLEAQITPGVCAGNCDKAYIMFTVVLLVTTFMGSTGLISNLMLNFRAVEARDKALTHGMGLTLLSFFALIPAPILFGRFIDSTCMIWSEKCGERGNCQLYDRDQFRFYVNLVSACFTSVGVFFDVLVWRNSKHLDLYGQDD